MVVFVFIRPKLNTFTNLHIIAGQGAIVVEFLQHIECELGDIV